MCPSAGVTGEIDCNQAVTSSGVHCDVAGGGGSWVYKPNAGGGLIGMVLFWRGVGIMGTGGTMGGEVEASGRSNWARNDGDGGSDVASSRCGEGTSSFMGKNGVGAGA